MSEITKRLMTGGGARRSSGIVGTLAARLQCEEAVVAAIIHAESSGAGFDRKGRVKVLFEKHRFWANLDPSKRATAQRAGLARKNWISPAKGGYQDQADNAAALAMLVRAVAIDEAAALKSASYGAAQVLGENFGVAGWPSVQAFVLDMCGSEDKQLAAMIGFMESRGLQEEMRDKDFEAIARVYNGPGQVEAYAAKMRAAYQKHAGRPAEISSKVRSSGLRVGSAGYRVDALQRRLGELGYPVVADSDFGPATRRAVIAFQADNGLELDGVVGPSTQKALDVAAVAIAPERAGATVSDLRATGSTTVKKADHSQVIGGIVAGGSILKGADSLGMLDQVKTIVETATEWRTTIVEPLFSLGSLIAGNWWLAGGAAGVALVFYAQSIKRERLEDHRAGRAA
jgi:hypothetical protein